MKLYNRKNVLMLVFITLFGLLLSACGGGGARHPTGDNPWNGLPLPFMNKGL